MKRLDSIIEHVLQKGIDKYSFHALVTDLPLDEACVAFALIAIYSPGTIHGREYSQLAKRLINAEQEPGGPYKNSDDQLDVNINIGAAFLFKAMGKRISSSSIFLTAQGFDPASDITPSPSLQKRIDVLLGERIPIRHAPSLIRDRIIINAENTLRTFGASVEKPGLKLLKRILDADKTNEITLLADAYNQSIDVPISEAEVIRLGTANLFCWMAYTIYDDIQDDTFNTELVALANLLQRQSFALYNAASADESIVRQAFNTMDTATMWEMIHCRIPSTTPFSLPKYSTARLANRSFGHIVGPLLISRSVMDSPLKKGLVHYLAARQLNDDIHDWKSDAKKGHLSFVVCHLLRHISASDRYKHLSSNTIRTMEAAFWKTEMIQLCTQVLHHVRKARNYYARAGIAKDAPFIDYITAVEKNAEQTIQQRYRYQQFLDSYAK